MFRPRVIPTLLLLGDALVKTTQFKKPNYLGDPINAVRIFNNLRADELIFLDIRANAENRCISLDFVQEVGEEANMPFAVGGGIKTLQEIEQILRAGAEKVVLGTVAATTPTFISEAARHFGSSSIAVCMDVKKRWLGGDRVYYANGQKMINTTPHDFAQKMADLGAGEIVVQSIERDGTMQGYDLALLKQIAETVTIPVVALGGAGSLAHLQEGYEIGYATGLAAGSLFVYQGTNKGVLINYPAHSELIFQNNNDSFQ